MTNNQFAWWQDTLATFRQEGREDADIGVFDPPYPKSSDRQDEQANDAYLEGFDERLQELGEDFKWRE